MRFLIKICLFLAALVIICMIDLPLIYFFDIRLGYLPHIAIFALVAAIGRRVFARWDLKHMGIDIDIVDGKKPFGDRPRKDYLIIHTPNHIIKICEEPQRRADLASRLKPYVKSQELHHRIAKALVEEYGINQ